MIVDEAKIEVKAGNGGNGGVYFRHEKYVPKGGPDGGDGGNGGDVIILASAQATDLGEYIRKRRFAAEDGQNGMTRLSSGKNGQDLVLRVPPGTQIFIGEKLIADLLKEGDEFLAAHGGNGGWGNQHFATSIKQTPHWAKEGLPGETQVLKLELKMIADVGLIGLPNAGKSTLLSVISNARPRIADYPFTTLEPNLGVVRAKDKSIVVADIPGLIHGASQGKGLGYKFLKHIERTKTVLHLIAADSPDPWADYQTIRDELRNFSKKLGEKIEMVALTKCELISAEDLEAVKATFKKHKIEILPISASTHLGIDQLIYELVKITK